MSDRRRPAMPPRHRAHEPGDRGAVLITVLLIVAAMAAVAVSMMDDMRFALARTGNARAAMQARWHAFGAEELARLALSASLRQNPDQTTRDQPWAERAGRFPVAGGTVSGHLRDMSGCFNVNSLVSRSESGTYAPNPSARARLVRLMTVLDIPEGDADALTRALTDWIDSDSRPEPRGAEDFSYTGLNPAYRAANTPIAHIATLRAIRGMTAPLYDRLAPYLCALPVADAVAINLNTLDTADWPLLAMLADDLPPGPLQQALAERPGGGFASVDAFWTQRALEGITIPDSARQATALKSTYFALTSEVVYQETRLVMESLIRADSAADIRVVRRRFGERFQEGRP
ncbi:type II secretion system minor pseudopilin GspK [Yunchengibacter salinarum]|uniref:type II secretion system minor pseudopilin GspK n=1 Tax=Yunchengibacter salinarum TaxID=3133399 RepID=UPI0035B5D82D